MGASQPRANAQSADKVQMGRWGEGRASVSRNRCCKLHSFQIAGITSGGDGDN